MNKKSIQWISIIIFLPIMVGGLFLIAHPASVVLAQQPTPSDDEVNAVAHQLFCPVCENTPLDVCDTEACRQWRDLIRKMLAEGKTEDEITQYFTDNYGVRVLSEPPAEGFNWLAYVVPPLAFLIGAIFLFRAFRTWRGLSREAEKGSSHEVPPSEGEDPFAARFEEELKKRK